MLQMRLMNMHLPVAKHQMARLLHRRIPFSSLISQQIPDLQYLDIDPPLVPALRSMLWEKYLHGSLIRSFLKV